MSGIWTRNFTNVLCSMFGRNEPNYKVSGVAEYSDSNLTVKNLNGSVNKINAISLAHSGASVDLKSEGLLVSSYSSTYPVLATLLLAGNGITPATYDDYQMSNLITTGLTLTNRNPTPTNTYDDTNHSYKTKRVFSLQNSSLTNITIKEIGLATNAIDFSNAVSCLIYHENIADIILEPNDVILITIEQEMPLYNYQPYPV